MSLDLLVIGAAGRMGRAIREAAAADPELCVARIVTRREEPEGPGTQSYTDLHRALDGFRGVVVDVALADGLAARVEAVAAAGLPLVEAVTGYGGDGDRALDSAAGRIPVVVAANLSPGVVVLRRLLREAMRARGVRWDPAVLDRHHRAKRDMPSGTARRLGRELDDAGSAETHLLSVRQGGITGEHTVFLAADDEELVLTHRALHRGVFARGALLAARFAAAAVPGRYDMEDVLGYPRG